MIRLVARVAALLAAATLPLAAAAQCKSDVDCKGNRICVRGECVDAAPAPVPPTAAPTAIPVYRLAQPMDAPDAGWGRTGGYVGLLGGAATLGLALVAEGMNGDGKDATALGGLAIALGSFSAAMAGLGSSSVRGVEHSTALRVVGWVAFGLALGDAVVLVATPDVKKPSGLITSVGVLALVGVTSLSIEAIMSSGEAETAARSRRAGLHLSPAVLPVQLAGGQVGATLGLAGTF
jgi:hypothetical protein